MNLKKLFVIYIGGAHEHSLIELHDMRFVIAHCIEDTYETLRQSWWGIPESLHVDAWGILDYVDGYHIHVSDTPSVPNDQQLYFVNLGGYDRTQFMELHKNVFVVAQDAHQAKQKAIQQISAWDSPHRDYCHQIDAAINLSHLISTQHSYYFLLNEGHDKKPFNFVCHYTSIGKHK